MEYLALTHLDSEFLQKRLQTKLVLISCATLSKCYTVKHTFSATHILVIGASELLTNVTSTATMVVE